MKKINRALAILLAVIMILATPFTADCATKTLALNAKGYKKVTNITKKGTYQLKCRFKDGMYSNPEFVSFQAPSAGTYVFTIKNLRDVRDTDSKNSFCACNLETGSELAFQGWIDYYDNWYWDAKGPNFKENKDSGIGLGSVWLAKMDNSCYSTVTVKYKLKKGEKIYFFISDPQTNYVGMDEDQTVVMDFAIKKK